ncbi:PKD domain-containing protein [Fulvivirgaceae bacterium BMA10]|uniref:PKD domain-containing protein n=1 Tax=Splendidivirga corallicola TaxID=3051826 RepID=A0ABT8KGV9_9BACT|nr:PKD domain-containing protein [Fulvivirgaceae bacterium BMA10]
MFKKFVNLRLAVRISLIALVLVCIFETSLIETIDPSPTKKEMTREELMNLPKYDRPDLAALHDFEMTKDPNLGYPPAERKLVAYKEAKRRLAARIGPLGAIQGVNWVERGPDNVAGRTRALMFDPNDANNRKVWAGGVGGGLWYNDDITSANPSWTNVDDFMANLAISSIAYDPSNTQVFYLGTGEGWGNFDAVRGAGIWKSTDGGSTWNQLASTASGNFDYVQKIVVTSSGTVIAAVRNANAANQGIMVSTDGGTSWMQKVSGRGDDLEIAANGDIYGSVRVTVTGSIHKSTDNGSNWTEITTIPPNGRRIEIATAPSNSDVVYAVASDGSDVEWFSRSGDAGANWSSVTVPNYMNQNCTLSADDFTRGQSWYDLILAVHPTDEDILIAGGIDLYRSDDGGQSWGEDEDTNGTNDGKPASYWTGNCSRPYVHADQHSIVFRPGNPNEAIFGNDGGVFYSTDIGNSKTPSFASKNNGYNVTQFYAVAAENVVTSNYFLAGAQDNGTQRFNDTGINSTTEVTGGDGAFCFIDQDDPTFQITSYIGNSYRRSTNGGNTFSSISDDTNTGRFINPADYDDDANILYAAGESNQYIRYDGITDAGSTPTSTTVVAALDGEQISHIRVSPHTDNRIFVGTGSGTIFRIDDAHTNTPTVTEITGNIGVGGYVSCIELGTSDDHILLTMSSYGISSVWQTTSGGTTWLDKEGNLPDIPVRWALYNPGDLNEVLLATEVGVWSTDDISVSSPDWQPTNTGLANVRCDMLQIRSVDAVIVVGTHGRGIFTTDAFAQPTANFSADKRLTYMKDTIQFSDGSIQPMDVWSWSFGDQETSTEQNPRYAYTSSGVFTVSLSINNDDDTETKADYIHILPDRLINYSLANGGNFESNTNDFGASSSGGTAFELGSSSVSGKNGTTSGSNGWVTGLTDATYENNSEAILYTPNFNFSNAGNYTLSFQTKFALENTYDGFIVEYSTDRGNTWQKLNNSLVAGWYNVNAAADNAVFTPSEPFFSGTTNGNFELKTTDVSGLAGNDNVAFRFVFRSDGLLTDAGLVIDDLTIVGPTAAAFNADLLTACTNDSVTFNNTSSGDITSVSWDFGEGASPATANTLGPHKVKYNTTGSKTVSLTINGAVVEEKTDYIEVNNSPQDINVVTQETEVCSGSGVTLTLENSEANVNYRVHDDSDDTILGDFDGNGSTMNITLGAITTATTYKIIATFPTTNCATELTDKLTITIRDNPEPTVSQDSEGILSTMTADSYQWLLEGTAITGATQQTYAPTAFGNYSVEVTVNGCSGTSDPFDVPIITGLEDLARKNIQVYPNPGRGTFYIKGENLIGNLSIKVYNITGKIFFNQQIQSRKLMDQFLIDISNAPSGMYFVEVENNKRKIVEKIKKID